MRIPHQVRDIAKDAYHWFLLRGAVEGTTGDYIHLVDIETNTVRVKRGSLTYQVTIGKTWH
jgi:hypothetical protein